jgi:nitrite reductase/ring-hydroxylating ferredoxin subunit
MIPLCAASAVRIGQPVLARPASAASVIVLRLANGELAAYRNVCPHMGIELDWEPRRLLTRNGRYLQCTGHGALFDPVTGVCVSGPCMGEVLTALRVRIAGGMVVPDAQADRDGSSPPAPTAVSDAAADSTEAAKPVQVQERIAC